MPESSPASLELFLDRASDSWLRPAKRDFFEFFERWRQAFEVQLVAGRPALRGGAAMQELESRLPADVILFREPTYAYLPSATAGSPFRFEVRRLRFTDQHLFNGLDVVVADADLRFCCLYTHEIGALADPWFCEGRPMQPR